MDMSWLWFQRFQRVRRAMNRRVWLVGWEVRDVFPRFPDVWMTCFFSWLVPGFRRVEDVDWCRSNISLVYFFWGMLWIFFFENLLSLRMMLECQINNQSVMLYFRSFLSTFLELVTWVSFDQILRWNYKKMNWMSQFCMKKQQVKSQF